MKDSLIFYAFKWPPYPETPKPGTPETLAGVWFWDNRGRKCCQAFDFQRNCQTCCSDFSWFGGGARFQTRFQGGFRGGFIPNPPGERESAFDLILLRFFNLIRFSEHRGRNCWQGYGFGTTTAGDAGIAGRGTVLGPPRPETLAGVRFWDQHGRKRWQGHGHGDMVLHTHRRVARCFSSTQSKLVGIARPAARTNTPTSLCRFTP